MRIFSIIWKNRNNSYISYSRYNQKHKSLPTTRSFSISSRSASTFVLKYKHSVIWAFEAFGMAVVGLLLLESFCNWWRLLLCKTFLSFIDCKIGILLDSKQKRIQMENKNKIICKISILCSIKIWIFDSCFKRSFFFLRKIMIW